MTVKDCGTSADVYAFGGVLCELFGEKQLWPGLLPFQIITKVVTLGETPDVTPVVSPEVRELCKSCFCPQEERPSMIKVLQKLVDKVALK